MRGYRIVVAALIGAAVGAGALWPANRHLRQERDDARKALAAMGPAVLVQAPEVVRRSIEVVQPAVVPPPEPEIAPVEAAPEGAEGPRRGDGERFGRGRRGDDPSRDDPAVREARRREFAERMREWSEASRTDFIAKTGLDEAKAAKVDGLVFDLNQRVESIVADWVAYIRESGSYDADFNIRFGHDLTGALVAAYDALDEELPAGWRSAAGDFDLMRMIDPDVMRPMMELQREMGQRRGGFFGGFMGGGRGGPPRRGDGGAPSNANGAPPTPQP